MSTLALIALTAALVVGTHGNPPPETLAREATPLHPMAAAALVKARAAEGDGRMAEATRLYKDAASAGSGDAAKRLGEIYWRGAPGVDRDLAESLRWNRVAETHGVRMAQAVRMR